MLMAGVPNKYAMERMGHSTDGMLKNVYQHTFKSKQEEYDVVLNDLFNKQDKKRIPRRIVKKNRNSEKEVPKKRFLFCIVFFVGFLR
ncbi:MAG: hypothetical protein IJH96_02760 [Ruminococcus sp.]|nr:hypothetical protein [Ruminococcus sp.]